MQLHADDAGLRHVELAGGARLFDQLRITAADDDVHAIDPAHHFFAQLGVGRDPFAVVDGRILAARDEAGAADARELEDQRRRLHEPVARAAFGPCNAAPRRDIAVAAAIDRHIRLHPLPAGFVLDDDAANSIALANRVDDLGVEQEPDARFARQLHRENFPPMRVDADRGGAFRIELVIARGAEGLQPLAELERRVP